MSKFYDARDYSSHREEEFRNKIGPLYWSATDLARNIKALNVAPTVQKDLDTAMKVVTDYLDNLLKHIDKNLR